VPSAAAYDKKDFRNDLHFYTIFRFLITVISKRLLQKRRNVHNVVVSRRNLERRSPLTDPVQQCEVWWRERGDIKGDVIYASFRMRDPSLELRL
jgi:hypothetical protein